MSRTALVVGGSRGIGYATAQALAKDGHRVAVTHRHSSAPPDMFTIHCDVNNTDSVDGAFAAVEQELGAVEIVVFSAGVTHDQLLLRMSDDDFVSVINTNLIGAARVARRASKSMAKNRWGRLVFISSAVGMRGERGQTNYAASKAGLIGLTRSISRELGRRNVTANVVAPGLTDTDMITTLSAEQLESMCAQVPLGRVAQPDEIAAAVAFLASERASYVTGAVMPVDGGAGMGH